MIFVGAAMLGPACGSVSVSRSLGYFDCNAGTRFVPIERDVTVGPNTCVRVMVKLHSPGYAYLLMFDTENTLFWQRIAEPAAPVKDEAHYFPESQPFDLSDGGSFNLMVLASETELQELASLLAQSESGSTVPAERMAAIREAVLDAIRQGRSTTVETPTRITASLRGDPAVCESCNPQDARTANYCVSCRAETVDVEGFYSKVVAINVDSTRE